MKPTLREDKVRALAERIVRLVGPAIGSLAAIRSDLECDGDELDQADGFKLGKDAAAAMLGEGTCADDWCDEAKELLKELTTFALDQQRVGAVSGETSDGYHTFNELYEHRHALFSVICRTFDGWKSKLHADGTMFDGWFIAGVNTPNGQATYHLPITWWESFKCRELPNAPECDGHTPSDVVNLIRALEPIPTPAVSKHGVDCPKVEHIGKGYLHEADNDSPYDVDGVWYCGRCHGWMEISIPAPGSEFDAPIPERLWCSYPDCPCDREFGGVCQYKHPGERHAPGDGGKK